MSESWRKRASGFMVAFALVFPIPASAEVLEFHAVLNDDCTIPPGSTATGVGTFLTDTETGFFEWVITHTALNFSELNADIHGPIEPMCPWTTNGRQLTALPNGSPKIGSMIISPQDQQDILNGLYHVTIHSNGPHTFLGEIFGNLLSFDEIDKNRYVTFRPLEPTPVAYKLDMVSSLFHPDAIVSGWVGAPDANGIASLVPGPVTRTWTETFVSITGCEIAPVAEFELRASADDGATFLPPVSLRTTPQPGGDKFWGDTVGVFNGIGWSPAQGVTNIDDAVAAIKTWQVADGAPPIPRTDVAPQELNRLVNIEDVLFIILAFQGKTYPFGCPADPCQDNATNPCS